MFKRTGRLKAILVQEMKCLTQRCDIMSLLCVKKVKKKAIYEAMGRMQECSSQVVESIEGYNAVC